MQNPSRLHCPTIPVFHLFLVTQIDLRAFHIALYSFCFFLFFFMVKLPKLWDLSSTWQLPLEPPLPLLGAETHLPRSSKQLPALGWQIQLHLFDQIRWYFPHLMF
ncbi:hypothetical protein OIU84_000223 [Salix udensis]|uniref:Uncharacterized protein n=1 Tax=Salix udensis TaxID=889485 RepID=A0AAD6PM56_9ROSI|nr:hypothetical protein OIU84_000223 [Salix udensis]